MVQDRRLIRIISDEDRAAAQRSWQEIDGIAPTKRRKKAFAGKQRSYVATRTKVRPRTPAADSGNPPVPAQTRSGQALLPGHT